MNIKSLSIMSALCFCVQSVVASDLLCSDPDVLLLSDRGLFTDTACVVPNKKVLVEGGYQQQNLTGSGTLFSFPATQVTLGLPQNTEIFTVMPNYNEQRRPHLAGSTTVGVGAKTQVYSTKTLTLSGEGLVAIPGGSKAFGSDGTGLIINALGLYLLSSKITVLGMLGESSLTWPDTAGGKRFNSLNSSLAFAYAPVEQMNLFAEIIGQTKTSPFRGSGVDWNLGVFYELNKNIVFDVEYVKSFYGLTGGFKNFVGVGATVFFN